MTLAESPRGSPRQLRQIRSLHISNSFGHLSRKSPVLAVANWPYRCPTFVDDPSSTVPRVEAEPYAEEMDQGSGNRSQKCRQQLSCQHSQRQGAPLRNLPTFENPHQRAVSLPPAHCFPFACSPLSFAKRPTVVSMTFKGTFQFAKKNVPGDNLTILEILEVNEPLERKNWLLNCLCVQVSLVCSKIGPVSDTLSLLRMKGGYREDDVA